MEEEAKRREYGNKIKISILHLCVLLKKEIFGNIINMGYYIDLFKGQIRLHL